MNKQLALFVSQSMSTILNIQNTKSKKQNAMNTQLALFVSQSQLSSTKQRNVKNSKEKDAWTFYLEGFN